MTDCHNFYYEVMSFYYQILKRILGRNVEDYVDDIVIKFDSCEQHIEDLKEAFKALQDHDMSLNPDKCAFEVEGGKFLGFMQTHCGLKANPKKCKAITEMWSPKNTKEI